ncbi:MAG: 23S rRNA (adenine(2503)-C(2))-methyltransferase RlmN [Acidimicrobiales bacterium]
MGSGSGRVRRTSAHHPRFRVDQLWKGLYEQGIEPGEISTLPSALRDELAEDYAKALVPIARQATADDLTVKRLWELDDGARIESVLMHYPERSTVCISSQAGCAMGCGFCATGQAGYERHLSVGEILEQVVTARNEARPRRLSNVVFMGMGEPFANFDRVIESIDRINVDLGIGARHITVSTVGLVPQIRRFTALGWQVGLAVSLHAANDDLRTELVPINSRHPIDELVDACREFRATTGRRVSFEWAMIAGTNDRDRDIDELAQVARRADAHVNLIPLNPTPGWPTVGTDPERIRVFARALADRGVNVTVRANRGTDIDAACGQLRADHSATPVAMRPRRRSTAGS